jgi:hypothetical protein
MTRPLVRLSRWTALAVLALGVPGALSAQDSTASVNHLYDKFQATLDFSTVLNNSEARVDGSGGEGTTLNFKDLLGISGSSIQPALGVSWKPGRHTELSIGYQFISQSGTRSFSDSLIIGDNTVFGQIDANTDISTDNANLAFKYAIFAKEKHIIGVELGLGAIFFDLQLDATADGCAGPDCGAGSVSIDRNIVVPTGALGVFGQWRLGDRWYLGGDARGIGGKVDRYDLSIFQADLFARYYFSDRWGAGAGWYFNDVTVDIDAQSDGSSDGDLDLGGKVSFNYTSLRLGVIAAF